MSRDEDLHVIDLAVTRISRASYSTALRKETQERAGVRLGPNAIAALSAIVRHGPLRLGAVADRIELHQSRASKEVQRLVVAGLVEQTDDPDDRRASVLRATDDGVAAYKRYRTAADDLLAEQLSDWSDRELRSLARHLAKLAETFRRPPGEKDAP